MNAPRFVHDDIVRVVRRGQIGTVREVHQTGDGFVYAVHLRTDAGEMIDVAEEELTLLKIANSDETGFAIRYITQQEMKEQFARRHIPPDPGYCSPGGASPLQAETPTLTTDWVAGPGSRVADLPQHVWLNDGTAILDDGVFERLDPVTAKRRPVLDMNRAVASLKSIDPAIDVHGKLSWPIAFNL